jgi:hypothetical protein
MIVYYAHCIALYNTPQEARDLETLKALGFEVFNPNTPEIDEKVRRAREVSPNYMELFREYVMGADALAFRALPDGRIPSGVVTEIEFALFYDKPVFELPSNLYSRYMALNATRAYLREVGQR